MDKNRLRRSTGLKIAAHIVMAAAFAAFVSCVILVLTLFSSSQYSTIISRNFMGNGTDGNGTDGNGTGGSDYFSSQKFTDTYGDYIDQLCYALETMQEGNNAGYPLSAFMDEDVNFKYGVYDTDGNLIYSSDGWSERDFTGESDQYYYTIDMLHLELFDVNIIRQADYKKNVEAVLRETQEKYASSGTSETESSGTQDAEGTTKNRGLLEYGSNFVRYTSFYDYDESYLASSVGYICTYVPAELSPQGSIYESYVRYNHWSTLRKWALAGGVASFAVMMCCMMYLVLSAGYSKKQDALMLYRVDRMFTELFAIIIFLIVGYSMSVGVSSVTYNWFSTVAGFGVAYVVGVFGLLSFARRFRSHTLMENSLIYRGIKGLYQLVYLGFANKTLMRKYIFGLFAFGILDVALVISMLYEGVWWWTIFVIAVLLYEFVYLGYKLTQVQRIREGAQQIAAGDLNYKIDTKGMGTLFKGFAEDINNIGRGLNAAVDERMKSERMKTELISNVSHDLKTPLTSIINYVDLLKREQIRDENIREYIRILDEKSQRLKALTEDLVEASRATSGNIQLEMNKINFVELMIQALGTYQDKFESVNLEVVMRYAPETMVILADGRRLFRVLDNLLNNIYKYAMPGTRVYIDMMVENRRAWLVIKNVSKTPLKVEADKLTHRFVRGDSARSTEGSGLGLAIAKSLTELHGGIFRIELDGDLFKVNIGLNCLN